MTRCRRGGHGSLGRLRWRLRGLRSQQRKRRHRGEREHQRTGGPFGCARGRSARSALGSADDGHVEFGRTKGARVSWPTRAVRTSIARGLSAVGAVG
jgi:hypothetical protein